MKEREPGIYSDVLADEYIEWSTLSDRSELQLPAMSRFARGASPAEPTPAMQLGSAVDAEWGGGNERLSR